MEGVPDPILRGVFETFLRAHPECGESGEGSDPPAKEPVTRALLYDLGLTGGPDSARKRAAAAEALGLPPDMSANAFFAAVEMLTDAEALEKLVESD